MRPTADSERVIAVHEALAAAGFPHAVRGAIALGFYAESREIRDIDVFDEDELHAAMPHAVRRVPFAGSTIPIVSPEHLAAPAGTIRAWRDSMSL
jgi:hypothetical protein